MKMWLILFLALLAFVPFFVRAGVLEKLLMSNKSYAKKIEVKTYVLTQEQVADLFKYSEKEPDQLTIDELNNISKIYLVVRAKNLGNKTAWGKLLCKTPGIQNPIQIELPCIRSFFCIYVTCIADIFVSHNKKGIYPEMSYEWSELYTK